MTVDPMSLVTGLSLGFGVGLLVMYWLAVRPLIAAMTRLRYDGFRAAEPPQRPKTIPPAPRLPRED